MDNVNRQTAWALLHDFDWDVCLSPEEHPQYGAGILRDADHHRVSGCPLERKLDSSPVAVFSRWQDAMSRGIDE